MTMKNVAYINLPEHRGAGGFDHADIHLDAHTVSVVDVARRERIAEIKVPGRTRWTIYDPASETFFIGTLRREEVVPTEAGAHTLALDRIRNKIYAFLPQSHRAAVFVDEA